MDLSHTGLISSSADPWLPEFEIRLRGQTREIVAIAYLDDSDSMIGVRISEDGDRGSVMLPLRDILRDILDTEATALVLGHNHPSGNPAPSALDRRATQTLCTMLRPLGVSVTDHVIWAGEQRISFRDLGLL